MKLNEKTRKQLRAGKPAELRFPVEPNPEFPGAILPCPLKEDDVKPIHGQGRNAQGYFQVVLIQRDGDEWQALVRYLADPVRLLDKGGNEYTDFAGRAMPRGDELGAELEAVDKETQEEFAADAEEPNLELRAKQAQRQEDEKRENKVQYIFRAGRKQGLDLNPLRNVLDRQLTEWEALIEQRDEDDGQKAA